MNFGVAAAAREEEATGETSGWAERAAPPAARGRRVTGKARVLTTPPIDSFGVEFAGCVTDFALVGRGADLARRAVGLPPTNT